MSLEKEIKNTMDSIAMKEATLKKVDELLGDNRVKDHVLMSEIQKKAEDCLHEIGLTKEVDSRIKGYIENYLKSVLLATGEYFNMGDK